jgi:hypothetical protein
MRLAGCGLLVAGLLAAGAAGAQQCLRPAERAAFDMAGLKSQLMITALTCDARDKYNAFVRRFQPDLMAQERTLRAYFVRRFGVRGQQRHDAYITDLANAQSQAGLRDGTLFCQRHAALFDEVLALRNGSDLAGYAASKELVQPVVPEPCAATRPAQAQDIRRTR